mgnify:CR=1 FL=1
MTEIFSIRREVFVEEQKVFLSEEFDHFDTLNAVTSGTVVHLMALFDTKTIGTGRLILLKESFTDNRFAKVGRIAVKRGLRQKGIGSSLMSKFHEIARDMGFVGIILSAQCQAENFYRTLGYRKQGRPYIDVGIAHQDMFYKFPKS